MLLMKGLRQMERSIGSQALDMPGLSYVVSTAEMGLRLALASASNDISLHASTGFAAMNVMSWVDASTIFYDERQSLRQSMRRNADAPEKRGTAAPAQESAANFGRRPPQEVAAPNFQEPRMALSNSARSNSSSPGEVEQELLSCSVTA